MRSVLASLAVIAPKPSQGRAKAASGKKGDAEAVNPSSAIMDKDAMYKEMRSSKTMKRKWREAKTATPKPLPDPAMADQKAAFLSESSSEEDVPPQMTKEALFELEKERLQKT